MVHADGADTRRVFMSHTECTEYTELYLDRRTEGQIYFSRKGAEGAKLYVLLFFCLKLNGTHSKRRDVIPWRLPTLWAPFGAFYFREHEFHEFHESQFAQVNFHAGKDLLIAYEFSRILPCGQKTGWHSCYLHAISKDISRMAIRVIREIRVLIITKFGNEQSE